MFDTALVREILSKILIAVDRVESRSAVIHHPDDFLVSPAGLEKLDSICMMLIAIGESLKNLDKVTKGQLLARYPEVDWQGAKGARDILAHHYFDVNAEAIFGICRKHIPGLRSAIEDMLHELSSQEPAHDRE